MNIFCLSPEYLKYLKEESRGYDFRFQGYSAIESAEKGLLRVNAKDLMGFCIVMDEFPEDLEDLKDFVRHCDLMCAGSKVRKRMVFGLQRDSGLVQFLRSGGFKNLDFHLCSFDILTDVIIKQELFGTVLETYFNAYGNKQDIKPISGGKLLSPLRYIPLFSRTIMEIIAPIKVKDTLKSSLVEDRFLEGLRDRGDVYYYLRKFAIESNFREITQQDSEKLVELIEGIKDTQLRFQCTLVMKFLEEKRYCYGASGGITRGL